jgi:hypothetical protein
LRLALFEESGGVQLSGPGEIVYDLEAGAAHVAPARVDGPALRWALGGDDASGASLAAEVELDRGTEWLMRCDRVDFGPGGVAYRHTHPGPGIRRLLFGEITIDSEERAATYGPAEAWFERGPDPVLATTAADEPSAFVRVMLVPAELAGQRTIRYVDPADAEKPKTQRATIFLEEPVAR